jgi:hypothetical protein
VRHLGHRQHSKRCGGGGRDGRFCVGRVRREAKRNIRVWLQDGSADLDNAAGNWPAASIGMANALKFRGYDHHFSFGVGEHNNGQGAAELPEALRWLWRDYDPAKTSQEFLQEPAEKDQPAWRVVQLNRK